MANRRPFGAISIEKAFLLDVCLGVPLGGLWFGFEQQYRLASQLAAPKTCLLRGQQLAIMRSLYSDGRPDVVKAIEALEGSAARALTESPRSVTQKRHAAPGGDIHDYVSLAKYWWPDRDAADGLPYERRDGEVNPECYNDNYDYVRLIHFSEDVTLLALVGYITDQPRYIARATELLSTWFIAEATRQSPHFRYAQIVPGRPEMRWQGLVEARALTYITEAILVLEATSDFDPQVGIQVREWFSSLLSWLRESEQGKRAARARNNIGFWYDLQCVVYAEFCGQPELARQVALESVLPRTVQQVAPDGSLPRELLRNRPYDYVAFTLAAMAMLSRATSGRQEVELWDVEVADGRSFQAAHDWLLRASNSRALPHQVVRTYARSGSRRKAAELEVSLLNLGWQLRGALRIADLRANEIMNARAIVSDFQRRLAPDRKVASTPDTTLTDEIVQLRTEVENLMSNLQARNKLLADRIKQDATEHQRLSNEINETRQAVDELRDQSAKGKAEAKRAIAELDEFRQREAALGNELRALMESKELLLKKLEREQRERADSLRQHEKEKAYLSAQIDAAKSMWNHYQRLTQSAQDQISSLSEQRDSLHKDTSRLKKELVELRSELENQQAKRKDLVKTISKLEQDCRALVGYSVTLESRLHSLVSSRSWRCTMPFRLVGRAIRSVVRGGFGEQPNLPEPPKAFARWKQAPSKLEDHPFDSAGS